MPRECVVSITSGSPRALVYMVADNPEALKHKIVVVHKTAGFIASDDGDNGNPSGAIVREILTRGHANYPYVEKDDQGRLVTKTLVAEGPISLITTSARSNLDPEMQNRLVSIPVNESARATRAIQTAQISGAAEKSRPEAKRLAEAHQAFQRWLQAIAPVRVVIPDDLRQAILGSLGRLPDTVRTRRDVPAFLLAIKAAAALHMAQRQKDGHGAVIATIEDYAAAHSAFDRFIAMDYSSELKSGDLLVLDAIEKRITSDQASRARQEKAWKAAGTTFPFTHIPADKPKAHTSYDEIGVTLNMRSRKTLAARVKALKTAGAIAIENQGVGHPAVWEIILTSAQASRMARGGFMPPPAEIEALLKDSAARGAKAADALTAAGQLTDWAVETEGEEPAPQDTETEENHPF